MDRNMIAMILLALIAVWAIWGVLRFFKLVPPLKKVLGLDKKKATTADDDDPDFIHIADVAEAADLVAYEKTVLVTKLKAQADDLKAKAKTASEKDAALADVARLIAAVARLTDTTPANTSEAVIALDAMAATGVSLLDTILAHVGPETVKAALAAYGTAFHSKVMSFIASTFARSEADREQLGARAKKAEASEEAVIKDNERLQARIIDQDKALDDQAKKMLVAMDVANDMASKVNAVGLTKVSTKDAVSDGKFEVLSGYVTNLQTLLAEAIKPRPQNNPKADRNDQQRGGNSRRERESKKEKQESKKENEKEDEKEEQAESENA